MALGWMRRLLLLAALVTLGTTPTTASIGYLVTTPGFLPPNADVKITALVTSPSSAGQLRVDLWGTHNEINQNSTILTSQTYAVGADGIDAELQFHVPDLDPSGFHDLYLDVSGHFGSDQFYNRSSIRLEYINDINVVVQADKPMYRPGATVNYRILLLDNNLLPVTNLLANITIANPYGQLLFQQQFLNFTDVLLQGSFELLAITSEGTWTISASAGTNIGSTTFQVRDYVLPKFSVVITPDPGDVITNPTVLYTICAKYTYGEDVAGTLQIYTSPSTYYYPVRQKPVILHVAKVSSCYDYIFNVSLLNTANFTYPTYPSINVTATVTEDGTGASQTATELHNRGTTRLRLTFGQKYNSNGQYTSSDNTIKLNLLYKGRLYVQELYEAPRPDELIQLCTFVERNTFKWRSWQTDTVLACRNYTTDADGLVVFSLPPFRQRVTGVIVQAIAVNFQRVAIEDGPTLEKPTAQLTLYPFYSPTASSIRIDRGDGSVYTCRAQFTRTIVMTADANVEYHIFFTLTSGGRILETQNFTKYFTEAELAPDPSDGNEIRNENPPEGSSEPQVVEPETPRSVGSFVFHSKLPAEAGPTVQLLVYYVHRGSDGRPIEVVSDSTDFSVQKCLENNVSMDFDPIRALPGSKVSLSLAAAGNSLCGVGVIDSSVTLLDGYSQLSSRDALLNQLSNINYRYSRTSLVNQSYCYRDGYLYNEPYENSDLSQLKVRVSRQALSPTTSFGYDSLSSFENTGLVIFTNLPVQTRPCPNRAFPGYPDDQVPGPTNLYYPAFLGSGATNKMTLTEFAEPERGELSAPVAQGTNSVRTLFPETWLWQIKRVGPDGYLSYSETLPDTITTWQATAVCLHPQNGIGVSQVANITGFQPLFVSLTLPAYMQRNEVAMIILTVFNYGEQCVAVRVTLRSLGNLEVVRGPNSTDALLCPNSSTSASFPYHVTATTLEVSRLEARAQTRPEAQAEYLDIELSNVNSSDTVIQTIDVRPEGFPIREIDTLLLCESVDYGSSLDSLQINLPKPVALVEGSEQVVLVGTGDILALNLGDLSVPAITYSNAEGTLAVLASSVYLLQYLEQTGTLSDTVNSGLRSRIRQASQAQNGFRSFDGSYARFGSTEIPRSVFLTAFAVKALSAARDYLDDSIDTDIVASVRYILQHWRASTGCFVDDEPNSSPFGPRTTSDFTAAIGVMLLESGFPFPNITGGVLRCIDANNLPSNHTTALNAYFSALAGRTGRASNALDTLLSAADKSGGLTSWSGDALAYGSVDTAGYAVITLKLLNRNLGEALPIIRWLTQQTYARYSFSYSEVFTVATQALTEYSTVAFSKNTNSILNVAVGGSSPGTVSFSINEHNKLLYQERLLNRSQSYNFNASLADDSTGCAALQVKYYYNSRDSPAQRGIQVNVSTTSGPGCSTLELRTCVRYTAGFLQSSAIVQITLLSGYSADDQSLKNLVRSGVVKRYVISGNQIQLIIQALTAQPTCFSVTESKYLPVANLKDAVVEVYDYYQYQYKATAGYGMEDNCAPQVPPPTSLNEADSLIFV